MVYPSIQVASLTWRKASHSVGQSECVEVAALGAAVLVRDSRDRAAGAIALGPAQWNALVDAIQNGRLDGR